MQFLPRVAMILSWSLAELTPFAFPPPPRHFPLAPAVAFVTCPKKAYIAVPSVSLIHSEFVTPSLKLGPYFGLYADFHIFNVGFHHLVLDIDFGFASVCDLILRPEGKPGVCVGALVVLSFPVALKLSVVIEILPSLLSLPPLPPIPWLRNSTGYLRITS
jgi:hypothetical protein